MRVRPDVLVKLLLLEDRYAEDFKSLLALPDADRSPLLATWEDWAKEGPTPKPDFASEGSRAWAAADPSLSGEDLTQYLTLAASFAGGHLLGRAIDVELAGLIRDMSAESESVRRPALERLLARSEEDQRTTIDELLTYARLSEDPSKSILSLIELARSAPGLAQEIAGRLEEGHREQIDIGIAVELAQSPPGPMRALAERISTAPGVDEQVSEAVRTVLEAGSI